MSHLMSGITATATIAALILLTASAEAKCPPGEDSHSQWHVHSALPDPRPEAYGSQWHL